MPDEGGASESPSESSSSDSDESDRERSGRGRGERDEARRVRGGGGGGGGVRRCGREGAKTTRGVDEVGDGRGGGEGGEEEAVEGCPRSLDRESDRGPCRALEWWLDPTAQIDNDLGGRANTGVDGAGCEWSLGPLTDPPPSTALECLRPTASAVACELGGGNLNGWARWPVGAACATASAHFSVLEWEVTGRRLPRRCPVPGRGRGGPGAESRRVETRGGGGMASEGEGAGSVVGEAHSHRCRPKWRCWFARSILSACAEEGCPVARYGWRGRGFGGWEGGGKGRERAEGEGAEVREGQSLNP